LFIGVPFALRTTISLPIQEELSNCFQVAYINEDYHTIRSLIQTITNFLNELKILEEIFLLQSTQSLTEICKIMEMNDILLQFIPEEIKCENYVYLSIWLIKQRSKLQELMINIEEKFYKTNQINLWNEKFIAVLTISNEEIDSNGGRKAITTADNDNNFSDNAYTTDTFRNELYRKIIFSDEILKTIIEEGSTDLIDLYRQDLVRTFCTITEKSKDDLEKCSETIKYVSKWLQLFDERDQIEFETIKNKRNEDIWLLCHVYTSFIYERNDLLSLYIACRTFDRLCLEPKNIYNNNNHHQTTLDRSEFREQIFIEMFNALWKNLCDICSSQIINYTAWIQIYSFVSRYYPSEKICDQSQLRYMRSKLELMQIAYILFLNETIPTSNELI
ncbi:unnamed protein product, partial [Didymodactylos carnosus]